MFPNEKSNSKQEIKAVSNEQVEKLVNFLHLISDIVPTLDVRCLGRLVGI